MGSNSACDGMSLNWAFDGNPTRITQEKIANLYALIVSPRIWQQSLDLKPLLEAQTLAREIG
jgi:hypothetical protein